MKEDLNTKVPLREQSKLLFQTKNLKLEDYRKKFGKIGKNPKTGKSYRKRKENYRI